MNVKNSDELLVLGDSIRRMDLSFGCCTANFLGVRIRHRWRNGWLLLKHLYFDKEHVVNFGEQDLEGKFSDFPNPAVLQHSF